MRRWALPFLLALLLCGCAGPRMPASFTAELQRAGVSGDAVALVVRPVDGGPPLLEQNAGRPFKPASVMKLVTTQAALELLGPGYRWVTKVHASGEMNGDVLDGDLVIEGSGDPRFAHEDLWRLLSRLRALGLREVRGHLVLDRSRFRVDDQDAGRFDGYPEGTYNAIPDALLLDGKALSVLLQPQSAGQEVRMAIQPPLAGFAVEPPSGSAQPCDAPYEQLQPQFSVRGLRFAGSYPVACGQRELHFHLYTLDHAQYVDAVFRALWSELGGTLTGTTIEGRAPAGSRELARWPSEPLARQISDINKYSNNPMVRNLMLTIAAESAIPATPEAASVRVGAWLAQAGIDARSVVLRNGSGLSREEKISADALSAVLLRAWRQPTMPEFIASLPVAGIDGTMARRLAGSPVRGRAHIKTGTLDDVASIAGYVTARSGRRIVVVCMINHPNANDARAAFDRLLAWVWESY